MILSERRLLLPGLIVAFLVTALALVACGGDGDDIKIGNDEDYVKAACEAQGEFFAEVFAVAFSSEDATEEEQLELLLDPVEDFRKAVAEARPPEDAVEYHRQLLGGIGELLDAMKSGDVAALEDDFDFSGDVLSESTKSRLAAVAEDIEECEGFGNPFTDGS